MAFYKNNVVQYDIGVKNTLIYFYYDINKLYMTSVVDNKQVLKQIAPLKCGWLQFMQIQPIYYFS